MPSETRVAAPITIAEAQRIVKDLYNIDLDVASLPGEYDDNFEVFGPDFGFVLKIMHPDREDSFVDLQCQALNHLEKKAPQLKLPRVIPTRSKKLFERIDLNGHSRIVFCLVFIYDSVLAKSNPIDAPLLESLGKFLAEMDLALQTFTHPAAQRDLKWDLSKPLWSREYLHHIAAPQHRALAANFLDLFEREVTPRLNTLRRSVIYGDANDHNVLVSPRHPQPRQVTSVIDFGDMHHGLTAAEPAIAAAYAILHKSDPLAAASAVLAGYHKILPLNENEIAAFFPLLAARLAVSVINSAHRKSLHPNDPYITISEAPAWQALERLAKIHPRFAHYTFRAACGLPAVPHAPHLAAQLTKLAPQAANILPIELRDPNIPLVLDLSIASPILAGDLTNLAEPTAKILAAMQAAKASVAVGRYDEPRPLYITPSFAQSENPLDERRTIHIGLDLFVPPGTPVHAPFDATVHAFANKAAHLDYGPVVILKHEIAADDSCHSERSLRSEESLFDPADSATNSTSSTFFTLYGHLSTDSLAPLTIGKKMPRGEEFARIGNPNENGGWPPHLHLQLILDPLDLDTDFPGVAYASQRAVWTSLSPDPNLITQIPVQKFPQPDATFEQSQTARHKLLGKNLSLSYAHPLKLVRGRAQFLFDDTGRAYLDVYNNVPLVGHSHRRVVEAAATQLALLNTNTRYLHDNILRYAERLTAQLPAPLKICYFLNSGSEANELALRLARAHTHREDILVLDHAYHGHTNTLIDISPYKFNGPGGTGRKPSVHVAPLPDDYRGQFRRGEPHLAEKYATPIAEICANQKREGKPIAAFIAETFPSVGGQIVLPENYLREAYQHVRAHGAVCIADEVQVGFGRLGTRFWGFETQTVIPDIVVLGKPIGNAFPLAAVVTTPEIAASFANGMEFFSTFGGNPVACAAGLAVLDILRDENLQHNALTVGTEWLAQLRNLQPQFPILGDVRGSGLFLGLDLVTNRETRQPATNQANYIVNRLRDHQILAGTDGPHHNVLKLRPPLIFTPQDAQLFTDTLTKILREDPAQP
jgi:4-aminobutyrate aminotransferase-like enzyme/Ser/Thr protein kinase RdoA (MazF antagonist)